MSQPVKSEQLKKAVEDANRAGVCATEAGCKLTNSQLLQALPVSKEVARISLEMFNKEVQAGKAPGY